MDLRCENVIWYGLSNSADIPYSRGIEVWQGVNIALVNVALQSSGWSAMLTLDSSTNVLLKDSRFDGPITSRDSTPVFTDVVFDQVQFPSGPGKLEQYMGFSITVR
jgi:hypothetical protein